MLTAGFPNIINDECISAGIKTDAAQKQLTAITSDCYCYVFRHLFEKKLWKQQQLLSYYLLQLTSNRFYKSFLYVQTV